MWWPGIRRGHPLARGLVSLWPLWEGGGSQSMDVVGGRHMTHYNTPTWRGGDILFDDGQTEYLAHANPVVLAPPVTMACWYRADNVDAGQLHALMSIGSNVDSTELFLFVRNSSGTKYAAAQSADSFGEGARDQLTFAWTAGVWTHYVARWATTSSREVGVDGTMTGSPETTLLAPGTLTETAIGSRLTTAGRLYYPSGDIAEAAIWNRALSDAEVQELYEDPWGLITPRRRTYSYVTGAPASGPGWWWGTGWREGAA